MLAEEGQHSPFDSINKLYFLGNKAEDTAEREWLFIAIDDLHQADKLRHGELAATVLKKKGTQYVDVLMFKRKLLNDLLHARIRQLGLSKESSSTLHTVLQSHSSYRNCIGFPDMKSGDATWNTHLSRACMMYCQLIEELVYGTYYDQVIKQILKYRKSVRKPWITARSVPSSVVPPNSHLCCSCIRRWSCRKSLCIRVLACLVTPQTTCILKACCGGRGISNVCCCHEDCSHMLDCSRGRTNLRALD